MHHAQIKGLRELAEVMRENGTKIVRVRDYPANSHLFEVRKKDEVGIERCIGRTLTLTGAEELVRSVKS